MSRPINDIQGIGPVFMEKLKGMNINTVDKLLEEGATKAGRKKLAEGAGIEERKVLDWVNMADLFRINGIGPQFSELLEAAGVDTVKELRNRNAENLHAKLTEVQAEKGLTKVVPALSKVTDFISQAKGLEPKVTY
jgi:predicted flap endonuclease-1-like 5' DNA nuclease